MYNLQTALDERLATLNKKKVMSNRKVKSNNVSKEYIESSLKQAGILNKDGKVTHKVAVS